MKVTVLGNRSPYPTDKGGCSSYLLQNDEYNILIDVGPDTLHNLNKIIPYHQLDAVIISHLHLDHFLDLFPLYHAIMLSVKNNQCQDALAVYLPFTESPELDFIQAKVGEEMHLQNLSNETKLYFGDLEIKFHPTAHSKQCFGIKINSSESSLAYTADTSLDKNLINFFESSDLLLAEASLLEQDKNLRSMGHMTVSDAVVFAEQANVKRVLLTHLASAYEQSEIRAEIPDTDLVVKLSQPFDKILLP